MYHDVLDGLSLDVVLKRKVIGGLDTAVIAKTFDMLDVEIRVTRLKHEF